MKNNFLRLLLFVLTSTAFANTNKITEFNNDNGIRLVVDGKDFSDNEDMKIEVGEKGERYIYKRINDGAIFNGASFGDAFKVVKEKLSEPIMFTEFLETIVLSPYQVQRTLFMNPTLLV